MGVSISIDAYFGHEGNISMIIESVYINGTLSYLDPYVHEALWFRLRAERSLLWFDTPDGAFGPDGIWAQRLDPLPIGSLRFFIMYVPGENAFLDAVQTFVMRLPLSISSLMPPYIQHPVFFYIRRATLYRELGRPLP